MELKPLFTEIADAIREKDGTSDLIVAETFPERIRAIETGTGNIPAGTLESIEIVRDAFQTVYLSGTPFEPDGIVVLAHFSSGETRYVPQEELTFSPTGGLAIETTAVTVDFTYGDVTARATQKISVSNNYIFGVCWNYGEPSPQLTRLTPASDPNRLVTIAVTTEPVPAIGTGPGSSPFDQYLPWSGMEEYNIVNNAVRYKKGQAGFSRTNYDTVVYIPEFYYRVIDDADNSKRYWYVSAKPVSRLAKHPGSGKYVGRYESGNTSDSKSGLEPTLNTSLDKFRENALAKGSRWRLCDYKAYCAVCLLVLVEYATWNLSDAIGPGYATTGPRAGTGRTDIMTYHTGSPKSKVNESMQYRWIENLYGNLWKVVDGVLCNDTKIYVCDDPDNYASRITDHYRYTEFKTPRAGYVSKIWYDPVNPWTFFPQESNGSADTYTTDVVYLSPGSPNLYTVGDIYHERGAGIAAASNYFRAEEGNSQTGARLLFE